MDWYYKDDLEKRRITPKLLMQCKRFSRQLNYVAGITDANFTVL